MLKIMFFFNNFDRRAENMHFGHSPHQLHHNVPTSIGANKSNPPHHQPTSQQQQQYLGTECVLYGSVLSSAKDQLMQRLRGLCDPDGPTAFQEHNMAFKLRTSIDSSVQVQMRRRFKQDNVHWHCRYMSQPEAHIREVLVRKVIDSLVYSTDMMGFVKALGLRMEYEYIAIGNLFTKGDIRILVYQLQCSEIIGNYNKLKQYTDSFLVEASVLLPGHGAEHAAAARALRDFADQLHPLCQLSYVDCTRE